ncbi:hypothetical protein M406DRAFT_333535 [Cryphonectria parasitica EP155]|uniref:Transcription factor domain-containing protein n=1 Tax=Cryphonectria parasitica (strain ATCC 38755 / EP155) TaxID=660469 RepID=A0A9P4XVR8_CRYP1|nr:uncharacterized protein M406DRAFT_333535 [Cryphonectria parasitica EP155]KAF3761475.1 hypothetical protein M406DRAFT_333535 [Cryphonectria parasitica EP155]
MSYGDCKVAQTARIHSLLLPNVTTPTPSYGMNYLSTLGGLDQPHTVILRARKQNGIRHRTCYSGLLFEESRGQRISLVVQQQRPTVGFSAHFRAMAWDVDRGPWSASLALPGLCNRYFSTFHKAIPIISPSLQQDIEEETGDSLPPAATSVLVLAMCLILFRPSSAGSNDSAREHSITPDALYVAVKTAFAHVQAFVPASTRLVQAGLLLSIFECTVVRMSHVLGLDSDVKVLAKPCQKDLEEWNVWWGVVIMER